MSKCLVTTLSEAVEDASLLKLNELNIHVVARSIMRFILGFSKDTEITINGDGYFTNEAGTSNLGKSMIADAVGSNYIYFSQGEFDVRISDKYAITRFDFYGLGSNNEFVLNTEDIKKTKPSYMLIGKWPYGKFDDLPAGDSVTYFNISNRKLTGGHMSNLRTLTNCSFIAITSGQNITGELNEIAGLNLTNLELYDFTKITGNINVLSGMTGLTKLRLDNCHLLNGNLSSLSGLTNLTTLTIRNTAITGNISSLSGLTRLTSLNVSGTAIAGDTSSLRNLTNLTTFIYTNTAITGTWPLT